jgi:hypothetical protein
MKIIGTWLLILGFLFSCPVWATKCSMDGNPQVSYDKADAVALVRLVGKTRDNGYSGDFEVIRAWKAELPKRIVVMKPPVSRNATTVGMCSYNFKHDGKYILYLTRQEDGTFSADVYSRNTHESQRKVFDSRLRELEKSDECGCKGYARGGFDRKYLYQRADIVVQAIVERAWKEGTINYADLKIIGFGKPYSFHDFVRMLPMTVVTEEGDSGCGYPITTEYFDYEKKLYGGSHANYYLFYLNYEIDTFDKSKITGYSTNICSGNLHWSEQMTWGLYQMERDRRAIRDEELREANERRSKHVPMGK